MPRSRSWSRSYSKKDDDNLSKHTIQAVLFNRAGKYKNSEQMRDWLKKHKLIPIKKVHKTDRFCRYWILEPDYKKYKYWYK